MSIIHADGLRRTFDDLVAVAGLNLDIAEGEIFGLVGPDGAGKTTTMRSNSIVQTGFHVQRWLFSDIFLTE